jgi:poly(ADP-ribose) glycohydrolase
MFDLKHDESVHISNYRQFNQTRGYRDTFKWDGIKMSAEPKNARRMIVMDALYYDPEYNQFKHTMINREIHKAHVGFSSGDQLPISTGHWGCGAFRGDRQLKAVIQMLAAGMAGKDLYYCVMDDNYTEIKRLADAVRGKNVRDVYTLLINSISHVPLAKFGDERVINNFFLQFCAECADL